MKQRNISIWVVTMGFDLFTIISGGVVCFVQMVFGTETMVYSPFHHRTDDMFIWRDV